MDGKKENIMIGIIVSVLLLLVAGYITFQSILGGYSGYQSYSVSIDYETLTYKKTAMFNQDTDHFYGAHASERSSSVTLDKFFRNIPFCEFAFYSVYPDIDKNDIIAIGDSLGHYQECTILFKQYLVYWDPGKGVVRDNLIAKYPQYPSLTGSINCRGEDFKCFHSYRPDTKKLNEAAKKMTCRVYGPNYEFKGTKVRWTGDNGYACYIDSAGAPGQVPIGGQVEFVFHVIPPLKTCSEQGGYICKTNEICSARFLEASDTDMCCSETCEEEPPAKFPIGLIIISVIVIGLLIFGIIMLIKRLRRK